MQTNIDVRTLTDRELLQLTADALGIEFHACGIDQDDYMTVVDVKVYRGGNEVEIFKQYKPWNPLQSLAQAMQVAIKLGISVEQYPFYADHAKKSHVVTKQRKQKDLMRITNPTEFCVGYSGNPDRANCLAIVYSAAASQLEKEGKL